MRPRKIAIETALKLEPSTPAERIEEKKAA
jgi:molecular chaperone IbpA